MNSEMFSRTLWRSREYPSLQKRTTANETKEWFSRVMTQYLPPAW